MSQIRYGRTVEWTVPKGEQPPSDPTVWFGIAWGADGSVYFRPGDSGEWLGPMSWAEYEAGNFHRSPDATR
jgi:hypothetical protein